MKQLYILILFLSFTCIAQTPYSLFHSKSENFFTATSASYLKGLRADSVKFIAGDSVYYHYKVYYTYTVGPSCHVPNYPSWLGTRTIRKPNEDYIFFNSANDSIKIKAGASVGATWTYYKFLSGDYIMATLASRQYTTTYNGLSDTVKSISFQAYNASSTPISHAYNSKVLKIARTQGIIAIGNIYDFPADVTFYDRSYGKHLTVADVLDLAPGDIVQKYDAFSNYNMSTPVTYTNYFTDTIATRVYITPDSVHITDTKANLYKIGKLKSYIVQQMPEQAIVNSFGPGTKQIRQVNYKINGTGTCQRTIISYLNDICGYLSVSPTDTCYGSASVSCTSWGDYKFYEKGFVRAAPLLDEYFMYPNYARTGRGISYSKIGGTPCGTFYFTGMNEVVQKTELKIYPNPANDHVMIENINGEFDYKIYAITGKLIGLGKSSGSIDLKELVSGIYFVQILTAAGITNVKLIKN